MSNGWSVVLGNILWLSLPASPREGDRPRTAEPQSSTEVVLRSRGVTGHPVVDSTLDVAPAIQRDPMDGGQRSAPVHGDPWRTHELGRTGPPAAAAPGSGAPLPFPVLAGSASFPGIVDTGWVPPDPMIAVGPNHVVETTNSHIAFFTRQGTLLFQTPLNSAGNPGFFEPVGAGNFVFDPKCLYDGPSGRFLVVGLELYNYGNPTTIQAWIDLAVSDDSNPIGTWYKYRASALTVLGGTPQYADYPGIAADDSAVYVNVDLRAAVGGAYGGVLYRAFDKTALLAGSPAAFTNLVSTGTHSAQMAHPFGDPPAAYSASVSTTSSIRIEAILDPLTSPALASTTVPVAPFLLPLAGAPQAGTGGLLDVLDGRILSASWRNGSLWASHAVRLGLKNVARWYQVALNGWPAGGVPSIAQWGDIDLGNNALGQPVHTWFPALVTNACEDLGIVFARSSASEFAGVYATGRRPWDPPGTVRAPVVLHVGTASYSGAPIGFNGARWGDYFGIALDPVDGHTFWGVGEIAISSGSWSTWIGNFTVSTGAASSTYGAGWPGTTGVPSLTLAGVPSPGATVSLVLQNSSGVATFAFFAVGTAPASNPTGLGGDLLVAAPIVFPFILIGPGLNSFPIAIPCGASLAGQSVYLQAAEMDPGASAGVSFTPGLEITLGS